MSFNNIKSNTQAQNGFTIVELLIVVVVIAILAAITIVSYNGITSKANQSASKAAAATLQKKAELYFAEVGNYPIAKTDLTAGTDKSYFIPAAAFGSDAPVADTPAAKKGTSYAQLVPCVASGSTLNASTVTGAKVYYYSYDTKAVVSSVTLGTCVTELTSSTVFN